MPLGYSAGTAERLDDMKMEMSVAKDLPRGPLTREAFEELKREILKVR